MSIVAVHGPNTMFTTEGGGTAVASSPVGATATKSPTNGLQFSFAFPNPGARPAADFDWSFTGPGSPAAQPNVFSGTVTFTGPGAVTIICTVAAGAGPPTAGAYTVSASATAGVPRMAKASVEPDEEPDDAEADEVDLDAYDPGEHTVAEVQEYADNLGTDEEIIELYNAEVGNKNRTTLVTYLASLLPFDPGEHTVGEVQAYAEENPDEVDDILEAERAGKNRSTLISFLEDFEEAE